MSWESRNTATKQGIHQRVSSISDLAAQLAQLQEQRLNRLQSGFGNISTNLQRWGEGRAARKFTTGEREAGEAHDNTQRILGQEHAQELERIRHTNDQKLELMKDKLAKAKTDDERNYWLEQIKPYEEKQAELDRQSRERQAREGRSSQTINTGDPQEQIATAWANFLAMNKDLHPEWVLKDENGEVVGINPPSKAIDTWRSAMYKRYGQEAVDEFLSLLAVSGDMGAGAGVDLGGGEEVPPPTPSTTVRELLPKIIGEAPAQIPLGLGTTFGEAYRMFVEPVQRALGLKPPKPPTPASEVVPPLKEKYYHPR